MPTAAEIKQQLTGPGGPFEVVTEEVRGRPMQVYKERMKALRQIWEVAIGRGDETFIVYGDRNISFKDFITSAYTTSTGLRGTYTLTITGTDSNVPARTHSTQVTLQILR